MGYNSAFEDLMDTINTIAQGRGFVNGVDWAKQAQQKGEISWENYKKFQNAHILRVRFSHGNAQDINVSYQTFLVVKDFERRIKASSLRSSHSKGKKTQPKLPSGTYRGKPFVKEFRRVGKDGEAYYFRLSIHEENNYLDDGNGGTHGYGYFIHIEEAPYLDYATNHLHEFHIIHSNYDYHICWNQVIESFVDANAIMVVWVNRYAALLDTLKKDGSISESRLMKKANQHGVLPVGTYRGPYPQRKKGLKPMKKVFMIEPVYQEIMSVLGHKKPELGGMLGFSLDQDTIDTYVFDAGAKVNEVEYNPNVKFLQSVLDGEWRAKHIFLGGFVHSHPGDFNRLSYADVEYAQRIMDAFDIPQLFMPIVTSSYEHKASMTGYIVRRNGRVDRCDIVLVPGENVKDADSNLVEEELNPELLQSIEAQFDAMKPSLEVQTKPEPNHLAQDDTFARISGVIDIPYMSECSIIGIGCGGARSFYESMARMGVGHFFLMDGDKATKSNIASQNGFLSEVGLFKPELIKKRLLDINEEIQVTCFDSMLTDDLDDSFIEEQILRHVDSKKTLLCAFTDSFYAQARISRIALKYHIPFLAGQHHDQGATSEVVYWYPGISKYSLREIAKTRYESFERGQGETITSVGSPIFNTTRLNALCEKIAVGLLLYGHQPDHPYCSFLNLKLERNLIVVKQKHLDESNPLYDLFDNGPNSFFDETAWIDPETLEDLKGVQLEEGGVSDTRDIFPNRRMMK